MTPAELQSWRARMGYPRGETADVLGVKIETVDSWIYGQYKISEPVAKLCKLLEKELSDETN